MKEADIMKALVGLLVSEHDELVEITLSLVLNLSFDAELRTRMVEVGMLPQLVKLLDNKRIPDELVLKLLCVHACTAPNVGAAGPPMPSFS